MYNAITYVMTTFPLHVYYSMVTYHNYPNHTTRFLINHERIIMAKNQGNPKDNRLESTIYLQ